MSINNNISKFANTVDSSGQIDFADLANKPTTLAGYGITDGASGGSVTSYTNASDLPLSGNSAGDLAYVVETNRMYVNTGSGWYSISLVNTDPSITSVQDADSNTTPFTLSTDGTATVITITASDPEDVPVTYSYSVTSGSLTNGGGTTATVSQGTGANTNVFTITPTTTSDYAGTFTLTFTVSDGINQATSANVFSLQFSIDNSKYTAFLLKADASASDNQVDASSNSLTITESGNVTSTALSPYHPKGYSTYFDGDGDYLRIPYDASFSYSSSTPFTIDMWFYPLVSGTDLHIASSNTGSADANLNWLFRLKTDNTLRFAMINSSGTVSTSDTSDTANINDWNHVSVVMTGSSIKHWLNGVFQQEVSFNGTMKVNGNIDVGAWGSNYFDGYIADFRYNVGEEVYTGTSDISVPTERLTANSYTKALVCHAPYIADGSSSNHSITVNGNTKTVQFGQFDQSTSYTKSLYGGSVYFDGASDYISSTTSSAMDFGTGDFTIEFWMYPDNYTGGDVIADARAVWNDAGWSLEFKNNGITLYSGGGDRVTTANLTTSAKQWTHVAFVRNSGTLNSFVNGVKDTGVSYTSNVNTTASTVRIGQRQDNGGSQFHGNLADFRIASSAVYTADFTPPTSPLTAITNTELLTCTNKHEIWDGAGGNLLILNGDVGASTTQYKWSNSVAFDGNIDSVEFSKNVDLPEFNFGTVDWTIEFWARIDTLSGGRSLFSFIKYNSSGGRETPHIYTNGAYLRYWAGGSDRITGGTALSTGTWYHIAVTRNNNDHRMFVNGTQDGSTWSNAYTYGQGRPVLGDYYSTINSLAGGTATLHGYVEDLRITKGLARYTSNFTAPTAASEG